MALRFLDPSFALRYLRTEEREHDHRHGCHDCCPYVRSKDRMRTLCAGAMWKDTKPFFHDVLCSQRKSLCLSIAIGPLLHFTVASRARRFVVSSPERRISIIRFAEQYDVLALANHAVQTITEPNRVLLLSRI
ncbi:hypothetical protein KP509_38G000900 [Ceratopteris richardii]|uniref:Uncharacterized protein n=1 Tax=Ceratopteris richardii TaxID=49495 RepID=A0A8T2Q227_CERRI|nr:hypothetical protein KP509_38G000900 [Ceratopteris richardii]